MCDKRTSQASFAQLEHPANDYSPVKLFERHFSLAPNFFGQTIDDIGQLIGSNLFALIGADILNQFDWQLDLDMGRFVELADWSTRSKIILSTHEVMGVPIVMAKVAERMRRLFFDTCAKISYLLPDLVEGLQPSGEQTDFFPGFGAFTTKTYRMPVELHGEQLITEFGVLPPSLGMALSMAGGEGILGAELLNDYRLFYSSSRHEIRLERFET